MPFLYNESAFTGGQEYDESGEYPHSNNLYPSYILPQHTYSAMQDLTAYGSQEDIDNPSKFYNKRSPPKKHEMKENSHLAQKETKLHREPKKLDIVKNAKEEKKSDIKPTTAANITSKSHDKKE